MLSCVEKKKRRLGIIGPWIWQLEKKGKHSILHFNDIAHAGKEINDTVSE